MNTQAHRQPLDAVEDLPRGAIVVGLDGSSVSDVALDWAVDQALLEHRTLVLAHAAGPDWADRTVSEPEIVRGSLLEAGRALVETAREMVERRGRGRVEVVPLVMITQPGVLLTEVSADAALLVLGSHGRGRLRSLLLGSVGVAVVREARCPVVVHRPMHVGLVRQGVLVGIDGTEHSLSTLEVAFRLASLRQLPLTVLHTVADQFAAITPPHVVTGQALRALDGERVRIAETTAGLAERFPDVHTQVTFARGRPEECLRLFSDRMDLLVVGSHHGRLFSPSTAVSVVEHATCPVVVVPGLARS